MAAYWAEALADEAETVADTFEERSGAAEAGPRLRLVATEREIAGILRRNAAKLHGYNATHEALERLPRLPGHELDGET